MEYQLGIISSDFIGRPIIKEYDWESKELLKSIEKKGVLTLFIDPTKLFIELLDDEIVLFYNHITEDGYDTLINISDLKAILVRRTRGFSDQIYDAIDLLKNWAPETKIYDSPVSFNRPLSKITSFQKRFGKFKQPRSIIIPDNKIPKSLPLNFPIIAKPSHGWRGYDVKKCSNFDELKSYFENYDRSLGYGIILQEKIDTSEEYRVLVINGKAVDLVHKSNPRSDTNNAAGGAHFTKRKTKKEGELKEIAEKCAQTQNLTFAGVDLTINNGNVYVIECNRNPEFKAFSHATRINVADKIIEFLISDSQLDTQSNKDLLEELKRLSATEEELIIIKSFEENFRTLEKYVNEELTTFKEELTDIKKALRKDIAENQVRDKGKLGKNISTVLGEIYQKTVLGLYDKVASSSVDILTNKISELIKNIE